VIITGAASGIGKATAELFAKHGAKVVLSDIDSIAGKSTTESIVGAGGTATFFKTDVSKPEEMDGLVNFAVKTYCNLDVAVNNV
jgi:NAD(P)-dependent dehydrogenase (short-subunit alcohol dehydrogenase family)